MHEKFMKERQQVYDVSMIGHTECFLGMTATSTSSGMDATGFVRRNY
jgi:hypothetical protein